MNKLLRRLCRLMFPSPPLPGTVADEVKQAEDRLTYLNRLLEVQQHRNTTPGEG